MLHSFRKIILFQFFLFLDNEYDLVMGKDVKILLNTTAYNTGESAYESRMFISHPSSFNYIGTVKLENVI